MVFPDNIRRGKLTVDSASIYSITVTVGEQIQSALANEEQQATVEEQSMEEKQQPFPSFPNIFGFGF